MKQKFFLNINRACVLLLTLAPPFVVADNYVARNGTNTDTWPYDAWSNAASNIQDAVNAATNGATIWVQAGTYTASSNPTNYPGSNPNVVYINKPLILRSESGNPENTIIDGENANRCLAWNYSGVTGPFVLDGFTLVNGLANETGGGILIAGSALTRTIRNCLIQDNMVTNAVARALGGGGLYASSVPVVISNSTFRGNMVSNTPTDAADGGGGGVHMSGAYAYGATVLGQIDHCFFESNSTYNASGAGLFFNNYCNAEIRNTSIVRNVQRHTLGNAARGGGGLIHMYSSQLSLWNCLIADNQASAYGSGIYNMSSGKPLTLYNCTVTGNSGHGTPYGAVQTRHSLDHLIMVNSIIYGNSAKEIFLGGTTDSSFHYSCLPTNSSLSTLGAYAVFGAGNLTNAPGFVNAAAGNYRLVSDSPCLNVGTNQLDWMIGALDLEGNPRIDPFVGTVDMGCYERIAQGTMIIVR